MSKHTPGPCPRCETREANVYDEPSAVWLCGACVALLNYEADRLTENENYARAAIAKAEGEG